MISAKEILLTIISSGTTAAILFFLFKKIIGSYIESKFKRRDTEFENRIRSMGINTQEFFKEELGVYPEVVELVYRSRNAAKACVHSEAAPLEAFQDFRECRFHIVENLYKYRIFFPEKLFKDIHRYKSLVQEFGVLLDETTRPTGVADSVVDSDVRKIALNQLSEKYVELDSHYQRLAPLLRSHLTEKTALKSEP